MAQPALLRISASANGSWRIGGRGGAKLQRVFARAAVQFEILFRQRVLELLHLANVNKADLRLVQRQANDIHLDDRFHGAQSRAKFCPILHCIEPDICREARAGAIGGDGIGLWRVFHLRPIDGLSGRIGRLFQHGFGIAAWNRQSGPRLQFGGGDIGPVQQLPHRIRIEMKCDFGEVARRAAPFAADVDAADQALKLLVGESWLTLPQILNGDAAVECAPGLAPGLRHGKLACGPRRLGGRIGLDAADGEQVLGGGGGSNRQIGHGSESQARQKGIHEHAAHSDRFPLMSEPKRRTERWDGITGTWPGARRD